jgi:uncharacterized membrane protein
VAAEWSGWSDGAVLLPRASEVGEVVEGVPGRRRCRVLIHDDEALRVLGDNPAAGRDVPVERLGELLLLGRLDDQQAGMETVLVQVADAVVAPALLSHVMEQLGQLGVVVVLIAAGHRAHLPVSGSAAGVSLGFE